MGVQALADTGYQGTGPSVTVPHRRRRQNRETGKFRPLSAAQKEVNTQPGDPAGQRLQTLVLVG